MVSWLDAAIEEHRGFELGQLRVEPASPGWVVFAPGTPDDRATCQLDSMNPEAIRQRVQCDDGGHYRPLSGARSLPGGWSAKASDAPGLRDVLEVVYPLATHHIAQQAAGALRVVGLDEVLERQSGRYAKAAKLSDSGRDLATGTVCGQCVREPIWVELRSDGVQVRAEEGTGSTPIGGTIPCPEPCSIMVSFCREAAQWEAETPPRAPVDPAVGFAAFETPGNALRETFLARAAGEVLEEEDCSGIPADSRH